MLHGFPQFWWTWRHQLPALAEAGYRVAALDLRGFGASDKPPGGYDPLTVCDDVAAIIRSLGASQACVIGHGLGGAIAWSMPGIHPEVTAAIGVIGMPHPAVFRSAVWRPGHRGARRYVRALQRPAPASGGRSAQAEVGTVPRYLREWSGSDQRWITPEVQQRYCEMIAVPFASHAATEYHRWVMRSRFTPNGLRYMRRVRPGITVPVLSVHGQADPAIPAALSRDSASHVTGPLQLVAIPEVGHFAHEEAPDQVNDVITRWLSATLPPTLP
ncbi:alpha/beta fold hydrolase [Marihabitans asiaticum]|uniref:alpha/beta fold hydrolase n=1 Tax=Marihabitans asiaticum TaxID=415218 RepID=UPI003CCC801A